MTPLCRALRLLAGRPLLVLAAGFALVVLAEASSLGLLALSGWFIASCYLAGAALLPGFSYLAPSGGVRSFALARIVLRYVASLITHDATLRWLARLRVRLFRDAADAGAERLRRLGSAEILDRALADSDTVDRVLLAAVVPAALAAVALPAAAAVTATVSGTAAVVLVVIGLGTLVATVAVGRHSASLGLAATRGRAQAAVVGAVDAWEELAGLGAVETVRSSAVESLTGLTRAEELTDRATGRAATIADLGAGIAALGVLAACVAGGAPLAPSVLVVLLAAGAVELLGALPDAGVAWRTAAEAAARLDDLTGPALVSSVTERLALPAGPAIGIRTVPRAPGAEPIRLDLTLPAGSLTLVRGPSGSGKTTLLRVLAGELAEGSIDLAGQPPAAYAPGRIVLVSHDDHVFTGSVLGNLRLADPSLDDAAAEALLAQFGLDSIPLTTRVGTGARDLSGGEARRLTLARAVAAAPAVLLLDEPTEGLDPATADQALRACRRLLPDATIVAVVHDRTSGTTTVADLDLVWPPARR
ncbi:ATP-binding cassette domain-containing protein [Nocardioides sp. DS6]|uniref:ATP-binding cassette domain-containing protein n=1 Tax=Nocardioides eburneus TaxID=3231482 RepID=A0ABV3T022_9ACTN